MYKQISGVDYWINAAGKKPLLPDCELIELSRVIQNPETTERRKTKAVNKMIEHNLRLVIHFVKHWISSKSTIKWDSEETCDLLQLGALGLKRAAEKYDYTRGYKFSTYAYNWIRQGVGRYYLENRSSIRIPEHIMRQVINFRSENNNEFYYSDEKIVAARQALNCTSYDIPTQKGESSLHEVIADKTEYVQDPGKAVEFLMNLAKLEEETRQMFRDYYFNKISMAKIAKNRKISDSEVRKRFCRAERLMRVAVRYNRQVPVTI